MDWMSKTEEAPGPTKLPLLSPEHLAGLAAPQHGGTLPVAAAAMEQSLVVLPALENRTLSLMPFLFSSVMVRGLLSVVQVVLAQLLALDPLEAESRTRVTEGGPVVDSPPAPPPPLPFPPV